MKINLKKIFEKKENLYLLLALPFGIMMVFLNPPFAGVPDEKAHFLRTWSIAQGNTNCNPDGEINKAALDLDEELKPIKISGSDDEKVSLGKIKRALFEKDSDEKVIFGGTVCGSNPLGYFPQILGIKSAEILNIPVLWGFYFARLFNMLVAVFVTYLALRLMPFGKIAIFFVALLPMTMQQYASLSYDALHISMIFLFIGFVIKISDNKGKFTRNEKIGLGVAAVLAANVKWGFIPILLLLFILPNNRFKEKKYYWLYVSSVILCGVGIFLIAQRGLVGSDGVMEGIYPMEQFYLALKNPFDFLSTLFNTVYDRANFFFETFLYKSGWLRRSMTPIFYVFTFFGLIFLVKNEEDDVRLSTRQRLIIGSTFLISFLFVFFSLYVFWSKVGDSKIQGVQGRYLLSIFPLVVLAFYRSKFDFILNFIKKYILLVNVVFFSIVFLATFSFIWSFYYDKSSVSSKYTYESYASKEIKDNLKYVDIKKSFKQTFLAEKKDLAGVKLYIKKGTHTGKSIFYLRDADCGEIIRKKELSWDMDEFSSIEIKFGAIANSENKKFCLTGDIYIDAGLPFKFSENIYTNGEFNGEGNIFEGSDLFFDLIYEN